MKNIFFSLVLQLSERNFDRYGMEIHSHCRLQTFCGFSLTCLKGKYDKSARIILASPIHFFWVLAPRIGTSRSGGGDLPRSPRNLENNLYGTSL